MPTWDFPRSVTSMRLMADLAVEYGVSLPGILAGTAVSREQLLDPDTVVSAEQELQLIRNLVSRLDQVPALGIRVGERYHFTAFGPLGFAFASSRTPLDALELAVRYFDLTFAFTRFRVDQQEGLRVVVVDEDVPAELQRFVVERDTAALITVVRDLFGVESLLEELQFRLPRPRQPELYESFFRVPLSYSAPANVAVLNRQGMARPMLQANELALSAAEKQCEVLLNRLVTRGGLAAKVRSFLAARTADMPTMERVADHLCVTTRTLRRRLQAETTTFAELRDEVRQALAEEYLLGLRLSVEQVAERLGYAEATSFINAFKHWHGVTPHQYRLRRTRS